MEWFRVFCICGIFLDYSRAQISLSKQTPTYLISAPRYLRPRIPTLLSVTVFTSSPVRVIAEIVNGNTSVVRSESIFPGGSTGIQVLPAIPDSTISYLSVYQLVVKGYISEDLVFTNSSFLRLDKKSSSTFIQTDKSIYRPGETVKIRTLSIYQDGKPCKSRVDIVIKGPKRNMIQQWLDLDSFLGVVSREFQLSENPPLGVWTIEATVDEVMSEKEFTVDYHVSPKFEVKIEAPTVIYYDDTMTGTVTSQYTYGKPVKGQLNVTAEYRYFGIKMNIKKSMMIDGSADFSFSKDDFHGHSVGNDRNEVIIYLTACVTEFLTGMKYNTTFEVTVVGKRYQLSFHEYTNTLKPYLNFSAQLKVNLYNGESLPPEDQLGNVTLTVTQLSYGPWSWREDIWEGIQPRIQNMSHLLLPDDSDQLYLNPPFGGGKMPLVNKFVLPVPASGVLPIQVHLSDDVATLNIEAQFKDCRESLDVYRSYTSPSNSYIQIQRDSTPAQVGIPLQLSVLSSHQFEEFRYLVISRGQAVAAEKSSSASFTLTPDESWAPEACVIVYCVFPDGEIINDAMQIPIAQVLRNSVSLSWSQAMAKPADEVTLSISVPEHPSLVGILVVDKATKWPKYVNDITVEEVLDELNEYSMDKVNIPEGSIMRSDPYSVFKACNLLVLTDAMLFEMKGIPSPQFPGEGIHMFAQEEVVSVEPRVRKEFPETWLWLDTNISDSNTRRLPVTVPDSITSWIATAFVMSDNLGLGLSSPAKLTVFQEFFLSLNLPPYIIRGEELVLEVNLFNYLPQALEVMVIVAESDSFEFILLDGELSMVSTQRVSVRSQDSTTVLFPIRPKVLGEIPISVKAVSSISSDAVVRKVLVKPEGVEQSFTKSLFLELAPLENRFSREINFTFPPDVVQGSKRVEVAAVGDIMGPSINGLDSLIKMPYGCGEQNMIHFAPNIYVLQYLTETLQVNEDIRTKAISFMMEGYQRELSYQRDDGSFSAFGDSDPSGSTWLSSFVLRCFLQARSFIPIDPGVLSRTAAWLVGQQGPDGAFKEPGRVIHTELQGGLDSPVSLTAYVLTALLEDQTYMNIYANAVSSGLRFLKTKMESGISSNYSLCLVAYTLSLANHTRARAALIELMNRADIHDNVAFWSSSSAEMSESWQPRSADIEMTAYVLLAMFKQGDAEQGVPMIKWLSQQRNHLGGYGSTQDTIIALQALSWYAAFSGSHSIDLHISVVQVPSRRVATFQIDSTNYLLRQSEEIETGSHIQIEVTAEGRGFALFQLNVFYNLESGGSSRRRRDIAGHDAFDLHVTLSGDEWEHVAVTVCTRLLENQGIDQTGMAIMEVGLLSGFVLAQDGVEINDIVKKVETPPGRVVLYLDSVTTSTVCIQIQTVRDFKVAHVQDALVLIYDYYEPRRRAERTYNSEVMRSMSTCFFCGENCGECGGWDHIVSVSSSVAHTLHSAPYVLTGLLLMLLTTGF